MNSIEVKRTSYQIARVIAVGIQEEWDRIERNAMGDPKGLGTGIVNIKVELSTTGTINHKIQMTVPGRAHKEVYAVTPSDMELAESDEGIDTESDPGEPNPEP